MKILVLNAGSSSLKYQLIDINTEEVVAKGLCERIGIDGSFIKHSAQGKENLLLETPMPNHTVAIQLVLDKLVDEKYGAIKSMDEIGAVGHRIVHSAEDFNSSVILTDEVLRICENNTELAPLHQPANIAGVKACKAIMPNVKQVGVFDTAFHSTIPDYAYMYGLPREDYVKYRVRRYGFHGTSHQFVSEEAAKLAKKDIKDMKIITCHLGNGASITAVDHGKSVDTSMGFTPLEGLIMGTRSGDLDPAILQYLMKKHNMNIDEMTTYINKKSGMLGLSGLSSDFRDLTEGEHKDDKEVVLAVKAFSYRVKKYVGAYAAAMGGVDFVVFTGGIGEHTPSVRAMVMENMEFLGIELDKEANENAGKGIQVISKPSSKVMVAIIPTNEELVIARETYNLVK